MEFIDFLNKYWTVLFGIASFIFALGYSYFGLKQTEKNVADSKEDCEAQMKEQKKDHDEKISLLEKNLASTTAKVDTLKDDVTKSMQSIQLDIREIMTILKRRSTKK